MSVHLCTCTYIIWQCVSAGAHLLEAGEAFEDDLA